MTDVDVECLFPENAGCWPNRRAWQSVPRETSFALARVLRPLPPTLEPPSKVSLRRLNFGMKNQEKEACESASKGHTERRKYIVLHYSNNTF
jgi:hypothetical protein